MVSERLLAIVRCPDCRGELAGAAGMPPPQLVCRGCGRPYPRHDGYLSLHPSTAFAEQTKYLDDALHSDARHEHVSPALLSAAIRNDMLRAFLELQATDKVVDLGCGSGRVLVWNQDAGAYQVGIDATPHFAEEALAHADLTTGDLRRLPFADGAFTKAYALDVLEHVSRDSLDALLAEAARVLAPRGRLFVYSHVRKNSRLALGLRGINALARALERAGLVELDRERLRKSDHVNPLADIPDLEATVRRAGFRIARIRYYTPLVGGFVENILMRLGERVLERSAPRSPEGGPEARARAAQHARAAAKRRIARRGFTYLSLRALTWIMKVDVLLFGRVRSGPFFALLEKNG